MLLTLEVEYRVEFVAALRQTGSIRTSAVENAFANVPRHVFIPGVPMAEAYVDRSHPVRPAPRSERYERDDETSPGLRSQL
ncbi:MAG: hypothetical protein GIX03_08010 [Candidatus Eremiobacteraeota bacterium]|nr:hypothetical protein [Candidatus Eremiobacteraeota bacterium]